MNERPAWPGFLAAQAVRYGWDRYAGPEGRDPLSCRDRVRTPLYKPPLRRSTRNRARAALGEPPMRCLPYIQQQRALPIEGLRECFLIPPYSYRLLSLYRSLTEPRVHVF